MIDRLADRLIPYLLQDRRIYRGVLRTKERIHSPCFPVVDLNRHLDMEAVIHKVAQLERKVAEQFPLDAQTRLDRVGVLVVRIDLENDPVGVALPGRHAIGEERVPDVVAESFREMAEWEQAGRQARLVDRGRWRGGGKDLVDVFSAVVQDGPV